MKALGSNLLTREWQISFQPTSYNVLILSLIVTGNTVPGTNLGVSSTSWVQFFKTKQLAWPAQFPLAGWFGLSFLCLAFFPFWCIHGTISLHCLKFPILGLNSEVPWLLMTLSCWSSRAQGQVTDCLATGSTTQGPRRIKPAWPSTLGKDLKLLTVLHTGHFLNHCYTPWLLAGIFSPELRNSEEKNIVSPLSWSVTWLLALIALLVTNMDPFQKPLLSTRWVPVLPQFQTHSCT